MSDLIYGQRVSIKAKLVRTCEHRESPALWNVWKAKEYRADDCIFLGLRTLSEGVMDYSYGADYKAKNYFSAALVSLNSRKNPVYVLLDDIEVKE